jgi:hypothetical protein
MQRSIVLAVTLCVLASSHAAEAQSTSTPAERAACQTDAFRLCTQAMPDRDRVRACLRQHMPRLNSLCRGALQRSRK